MSSTRAAEQYERMVEPHRGRLRRYAYRLSGNHAEAEDLVQETLVRAYARVHLLDNTATVSGWLHTVLLNVFRNRLRAPDVLARRPLSYDEDWTRNAPGGGGSTAGDASLDPERRVLRSEERAAILKMLQGLPETYREAVFLYDVEGRSYQAIAEGARVPVGTVRSRINRGRKHLRQRLAAWQD
jgi:RNA polymerase sigma factor, sigma-70 family